MTTFLTAEWKNLVMLNYACDRSLLAPLVPAGTELDDWRGTTLISLVGFLFVDARVRGIAVPFHRTFEEVNLRFYVRRVVNGDVKRAVVFIRELVPRQAIATIARIAYNEPYLAVPMHHSATIDELRGGQVAYGWHHAGLPFVVSAEVSGAAQPLEPGSEAEFITEHYWGYTRQRNGDTLEYRVEHPRWRVWTADRARIDGDTSRLYGQPFAALLATPPKSAFVALGSGVRVHHGTRLGLRRHSRIAPD